MSLAFGLFVAAMGRWAWPECVESAWCRSRGCRDCTLLVACDAALLRLDSRLPPQNIWEAKPRE